MPGHYPVIEREDWNRKHAEGGHHFGGAPNRFLVAAAEGLEPGRALDLACGTGRNAVWLAERGWRVTGVDFSDVALAEARALAAERGVEVEWVEADVLAWAPPAAAFDLVVVSYLQLPAEERRAVLAGAAAALSGGGTFFLVAHDRTNRVGGPKDPGVLYTPEEIAADLPGLEVERAERVDRDGAVDTLVLASAP